MSKKKKSNNKKTNKKRRHYKYKKGGTKTKKQKLHLSLTNPDLIREISSFSNTNDALSLFNTNIELQDNLVPFLHEKIDKFKKTIKNMSVYQDYQTKQNCGNVYMKNITILYKTFVYKLTQLYRDKYGHDNISMEISMTNFVELLYEDLDKFHEIRLTDSPYSSYYSVYERIDTKTLFGDIDNLFNIFRSYIKFPNLPNSSNSSNLPNLPNLPNEVSINDEYIFWYSYYNAWQIFEKEMMESEMMQEEIHPDLRDDFDT